MANPHMHSRNVSACDCRFFLASLLNALRDSAHLKQLDLSGFGVRENVVLDALTTTLFENKGLVYLGLETV
jgi:hypothetical protein